MLPHILLHQGRKSFTQESGREEVTETRIIKARTAEFMTSSVGDHVLGRFLWNSCLLSRVRSLVMMPYFFTDRSNN